MTPLFWWKRSDKKTDKELRRRQLSRARSERDAAALSQSHTVGCQWFPWGRGLRVRSASQESCSKAATGSPAAREPRARSPSPRSGHGQPSCRILQEAQKYQVSRHGSFCSEGSCASVRGAVGGSEALCCKHSSMPIGGYEGGYCLASPQEPASNSLYVYRFNKTLCHLSLFREYLNIYFFKSCES